MKAYGVGSNGKDWTRDEDGASARFKWALELSLGSQSTSPAEATNKCHSTMAFKSHQFSYFWWAKEKNIEFPSESGTLLGVNVSCFDILR